MCTWDSPAGRGTLRCRKCTLLRGMRHRPALYSCVRVHAAGAYACGGVQCSSNLFTMQTVVSARNRNPSRVGMQVSGQGEKDDGHLRIQAPSFMSVPDFSQHRDDSTTGSRAGTEAVSALAPLKLRSSVLSAWTAEEPGARCSHVGRTVHRVGDGHSSIGTPEHEIWHRALQHRRMSPTLMDIGRVLSVEP